MKDKIDIKGKVRGSPVRIIPHGWRNRRMTIKLKRREIK